MKDTEVVGKKFGRLTIMKIIKHNGRNNKAECLCDCGNSKVLYKFNVIYGITASCGCIRMEHNKRLTTHGMSRTAEFKTWLNMRRRCLDKNTIGWANYGGRGIGVCHQWIDSFERFYKDVGPKPSPKHSLDRINNDGDYEPGNCRWATREQQQNNTSKNIRYNYRGKFLTIPQISRITKLKSKTLWLRIKSRGIKPNAHVDGVVYPIR